ncbi:unnamed protein product [Caretta caretta]
MKELVIGERNSCTLGESEEGVKLEVMTLFHSCQNNQKESLTSLKASIGSCLFLKIQEFQDAASDISKLIARTEEPLLRSEN